MRGEGSQYILLGPANPTGPWHPPILNTFFSDHTNITSTMHFFACLSRPVYASHTISFISLCKTLCLWRSLDMMLCWLLILLPPSSRFLLGWMNTAPPEWQLQCTNQHGPIPLEDFSLLQHCCDNLECCLLDDNPTNARLQICTITYYLSAICFGHLRDHHEGFL